MVHVRRLLSSMSVLSLILSAGARLWAELARCPLFVLPLGTTDPAMLELAELEGLNGNCFTSVWCIFLWMD